MTPRQITTLANRIAKGLFTEGGTNKRAKRLVLDVKDEFEGQSGWCEDAIRFRIADEIQHEINLRQRKITRALKGRKLS